MKNKKEIKADKEREFIRILTQGKERNNQGLYSGELTESRIINAMHDSGLIKQLGSSLEKNFRGMRIRRNLKRVYAPDKGGRDDSNWYDKFRFVKLTKGLKEQPFGARAYIENCSQYTK